MAGPDTELDRGLDCGPRMGSIYILCCVCTADLHDFDESICSTSLFLVSQFSVAPLHTVDTPLHDGSPDRRGKTLFSAATAGVAASKILLLHRHFGGSMMHAALVAAMKLLADKVIAAEQVSMVPPHSATVSCSEAHSTRTDSMPVVATTAEPPAVPLHDLVYPGTVLYDDC